MRGKDRELLEETRTFPSKKGDYKTMTRLEYFNQMGMTEYSNQMEQSFFSKKETEELANYINHYYCEFKNWTNIVKMDNTSTDKVQYYNVYTGKKICPRNYIGRIERYSDGKDIVYSKDELVFYQEDGMVTDDRFGTRNRNRIIRFSPKYRETYGSNIREKIITDDYIEKAFVNGESVRESFI